MREKLLVSSCLLGEKVRYDGEGFQYPEILALSENYDLHPFCPEVSGGLSIPRPPAERSGVSILTKNGKDVSAEYRLGAEKALAYCLKEDIRKAVLKSRSPSCGKGQIYDGTFTKTLTEGHGVTAELFLAHGIEVYTEEDLGGLK